MSENLVFTYGTLKRGHGNNRLLATSEFLAPAVTDAEFMLLQVGFPIACLEGSPKYPVLGEIWKCDDETLARLDRLEGVPHHYQRTTVTVRTPAGYWLHDIYIYTQRRPRYQVQTCPVIDGLYVWGGR